MCKSSPFVVILSTLYYFNFGTKQFSFVTVPFERLQLFSEIMFYSGGLHTLHCCTISLMSLFSLFQLFSGASLSDRSQTETNTGEERISIRRSLTDSLAVSSMLLLQPQQVSLVVSHFEAR